MTSTMRRLIRFLSIIFMVSLSGPALAAPLASYNGDPHQVTVSGVSSGGAMAVQAHVAYSGTFKGAAIFAGNAYYCAEGSLAFALTRCMEAVSAAQVPVASLVSTTRYWATQGLIDSTANLANAKVYLFSGVLDQTVRPPAMDALRDYYLNFVTPANVVYNNQVLAGHSWVSLLGPNPCEVQQSPYLNNCNLDVQQTFLSLFYGALQPKQAGQLSGQFLAIDQAEFLDDRNPVAHGLDTHAWLYVPAACSRGELCKVHVAFHGCNMSYQKIGDQFVRRSGLNEWADTNNLIVLYPQIFPSLTEPVNGQGCWDWWGYDDADYAKKSGRQLLMTKRMVDRITSGYAPVAAPQNLAIVTTSPNAVKLSWNTVSGARGYNVYRNNVLVNGTPLASASFRDSGLAANASYAYTVRAVAANGNQGPASEVIVATTR